MAERLSIISERVDDIPLLLAQLERMGVRPRWTSTSPPMATGRVGRVPEDGTWLPVEVPLGYLGLEHSLKGRDQLPQLVHSETGQIQPLHRAGLDVGEASTPHGCGFPLGTHHSRDPKWKVNRSS